MEPDKAEVRRLLNLLETFTRMLGVSRREAERRLGVKHSAVTRLFNGQIEPKLELILGVVRAIGLEYDEFFALVYPEQRTAEPRSESARYLHMMIRELYPAAFRDAPPPQASMNRADELLEKIRSLVGEAFGETEPEEGAPSSRRKAS